MTKGASEPDESGIADFVKSLETNDRRRCLGDASPEERVSETIPDSAQRGAASKSKANSAPRGAESMETRESVPRRAESKKKKSRPEENGINEQSDNRSYCSNK